MRLAAQATRTANGRMHASLRSVVSPRAVRSLEDLGMRAEALPEEPDDFDGIMR
jgi:hypothetical protein